MEEIRKVTMVLLFRGPCAKKLALRVWSSLWFSSVASAWSMRLRSQPTHHQNQTKVAGEFPPSPRREGNRP